jgi:hypothetical protein
MAFPDFDALLVPINISESIYDILSRTDEHAILVQQQVMAANGQVEARLDIPIGSRFTEVMHPQPRLFFAYPFLIVQPQYTEQIHVHDAILRNRSERPMSFCGTTVNPVSQVLPSPCYKELVFFHYFTKSFEEYERKCARGDNGRPAAIKLPKDYVKAKFNNLGFYSSERATAIRFSVWWTQCQ